VPPCQKDLDHLNSGARADRNAAGASPGPVEEAGMTSMADYVLVDMVVIAFANTRSRPGFLSVLPAHAARTLEEGL
jgi:hypothetical protein